MLGRVGELFHFNSPATSALFPRRTSENTLRRTSAARLKGRSGPLPDRVCARLGAIAAPTEGRISTADICAALERRGRPPRVHHAARRRRPHQPRARGDIAGHRMHENTWRCPRPPAMRSTAARAAGGRVIAVGTTVGEEFGTAAARGRFARRERSGCGRRAGAIAPYRGGTRIFIKRATRFAPSDAMVTNFHLPESTLLMLCSAFADERRCWRRTPTRCRRGIDFSATVTRCF